MGSGIDGAINVWYHHRGQINREGTHWERKMLAKQLEGGQENKKERTSIMSCTSEPPSPWCWTFSVTVALLGQESVCFDCRCNEYCHSIATTPISSCIMHAYSAYFFQIMAKQQNPACMEGLFYMCSQCSLTEDVQRASKEVWSKWFWFKQKHDGAVFRQMWCAPVGIFFFNYSKLVEIKNEWPTVLIKNDQSM